MRFARRLHFAQGGLWDEKACVLALCLLLALALHAEAAGLDDAIFVLATEEDAIALLEKGTGVLLIGAEDDMATRTAATAVVASAEEAGLAQVLYIEQCPEGCAQRLADYALQRGTSFANATGDGALLDEVAAGEAHGLLVFVNHGAIAGMQTAPALSNAASPDQIDSAGLEAFSENIKRYASLIATDPCPGHC